MPTIIITPDQDAVISEIEIAAPPARVFQALTKSAELSRWFASPECPAKLWEMDPRVGGAYHYETVKGSVVVNGVSEFECHGEILEYDPPRVLVYTWLAKPKHWGSLWKDSTKASRFFVSSLLSISFSGIGLP